MKKNIQQHNITRYHNRISHYLTMVLYRWQKLHFQLKNWQNLEQILIEKSEVLFLLLYYYSLMQFCQFEIVWSLCRKRCSHLWKETPSFVKRNSHLWKETVIYEKWHSHLWKRHHHLWKETYLAYEIVKDMDSNWHKQ